MDFGRTGIAHHLDNLEAGRATHDRVVDENNALAFDQRAIGVVLQFYAQMPDLIARLNEAGGQGPEPTATVLSSLLRTANPDALPVLNT